MSDTTTTVNDPENTTIDELRALIREAEEALTSAGGDEVEELRERLRGAVAEGQNLLHNLTDKVRQQAQRADEAIRANPYQTIGIAAGVGVLVGFLLSRRLSSHD
jgi:ElaB/YqjD/DUF883 family membrane-anchored ribosome-binding protein